MSNEMKWAKSLTTVPSLVSQHMVIRAFARHALGTPAASVRPRDHHTLAIRARIVASGALRASRDSLAPQTIRCAPLLRSLSLHLKACTILYAGSLSVFYQSFHLYPRTGIT
jgi:hypothetical protein